MAKNTLFSLMFLCSYALVDEGKTLCRKLAFRAELARNTKLVKTLRVIRVLRGKTFFEYRASSIEIRSHSVPFFLSAFVSNFFAKEVIYLLNMPAKFGII